MHHAKHYHERYLMRYLPFAMELQMVPSAPNRLEQAMTYVTCPSTLSILYP